MGEQGRRKRITIEITPYLRKRMLQRGITEGQVREAIINPSKTLSNPPNEKTGTPRKKHLKRLGGKFICVVVEYVSEQYWVAVTTYPKRKT